MATEAVPLKEFDDNFGVSVADNMSSNNIPSPTNGAQDDTAKKLEQLMTIGSGLVSYAQKINPLQGVKNAADATVKIRKEAQNLFNPTAFSKPKDRAEWMSRLSANTSYFRLSYTVAFCFTTVYSILTSPFLLFELGLLGGMWFVFFKLQKADDVLTVGQYQLGRKEKMAVFVPLSLFVAFFGGLLSSLIYIVLFGGFIVGAHASFRHPVEADPLDALDDTDVNIPAPDFV